MKDLRSKQAHMSMGGHAAIHAQKGGSWDAISSARESQLMTCRLRAVFKIVSTPHGGAYDANNCKLVSRKGDEDVARSMENGSRAMKS